jgi:hypothetical protein
MAANPLADGNIDAIPAELWKQMNISKEDFLALREQMIEREKRTPAAGTEAPDFEIERLSEKGERTGQTLKLSSLRGRPVGLIFGSYT